VNQKKTDRTPAVRRLVRALPLAVVAVALGAAGLAAQAAPQAAGMTLSETLRTALERSPRIEAARFALEEAEERVSEAWGSVYPRVDFSADYTRNVSPAVNFLPAIIFNPNAGPDEQVAVQFGADNLWQSMITLEQPLFDGRAFIGVGAAGRFQSLQEEVLRGEIQNVLSQVRTLYYDALLAQEQLRLTENSLTRVREALVEVRALHKEGFGSEYDVLRLEVEVSNLEPNLRRAQNSVQQKLRDLAVELDVDPASLRVEGSLATLVLGDATANTPANSQLLASAGAGAGAIDEEALVQEALRSRSDVRQLEVTEELRVAELRAEQTTYLPRVSLFGNYAVSASQNGAPDFFGNPRAYSRRVGLQVSVPLFEGFSRNARVAQRRANIRVAESQSRFLRSRAESDVRRYVQEVEESRLRAEGQKKAVAQAQRGFDIVRAEFREGIGSRLDVTDAEVALRQSEFNYAQAVYDYLSARARLDQATGLVPTTAEELVP
jgi:outer membrane protein TolC